MKEQQFSTPSKVCQILHWLRYCCTVLLFNADIQQVIFYGYADLLLTSEEGQSYLSDTLASTLGNVFLVKMVEKSKKQSLLWLWV